MNRLESSIVKTVHQLVLSLTCVKRKIFTIRSLVDHCQKSMWQKMQEGVTSQCTNCQGNEELQQMLVENPLHEGNYDYTQDSTQ